MPLTTSGFAIKLELVNWLIHDFLLMKIKTFGDQVLTRRLTY